MNTLDPIFQHLLETRYFGSREILTNEILCGENDGICSNRDLVCNLLGCCAWKKRAQLTVFWNRTKNELESELYNFSEPSTPLSDSVLREYVPPHLWSIQDKIRSLLLRVKFWNDPILLQFWAPVRTTTGQIMLTTTKEPFGLGQLYNGLCRYRYYCIKHERDYGRENNWQVGPPVRVFRQGSPEFCPNIECYSTEEFPLKIIAMECDIVGYWALPLFKRDAQLQNCVGVLECLSFSSTNTLVNYFDPVFSVLKDLDLACPILHSHECNKIRKDILSPREDLKSVLNFVREAHHLPLIQVWIPCMCDDPEAFADYDQNNRNLSDASSKITELFCDMRCCDRSMKYFSEFAAFNSKYGIRSVKNGKGLVERAYSQKKSCFFRATNQFSISDYPFVHLTRSSGLTDCFAIPLELIHPMLDALLLEIFLPPEQNWNGNVEAMLESLLSTVAQGFSRLNSALVLKQGEEFQVKFASDDKSFVYFDIYRSSNNLIGHEGFVSGREVQLFISSEQPPTSEDNVENCQSNATARMKHSILTHHPNTQNRAVISEEVFTKPQITLDALEPYIGGNLADALKEFKVSRSTLKRRCRELGIHRWPSHKRKKTSSVKGGEVIQEFEIGRCPNNNATEKGAAAADSTRAKAKSIDTENKSDHSYSMIVKATYKDDIVKFPLCSNSGIEELRRELDKRFELKAETERFKIKYEDEGDWILMSCDEDLRFRMDTLKSSGQTRMDLSVFPATL